MRKIFALCLSVLVIASCTDPFDASSIWDKLNEHENKINDIENGANGSYEIATNKIYYTTSDGKKLFPNKTEPTFFGAILVSNIYENGVGVLTFDDDITIIGEEAFYDCSDLTSITIPSTVTAIKENAFLNCTGLTAVYINDLSAWCRIDLGNADANPTNYAHNLYLNGSLITHLVIPNDITEIKNQAFRGCQCITSATIHDGVTKFGQYSFNTCTNMTSIKLPVNLKTISRGLFSGCNKLSDVTIPESVTNIEYSAFYGCALTSIIIPKNVEFIDGNSFNVCTDLKTVINYSNLNIVKGSEDLGCVAYYADKVINASDYLDFVFNVFNGVNILSEYLGNATNLILPDDYYGENYEIGNSAFSGRSGLTSITIPNSITRIDTKAFYGCSNLKTIINFSNLELKKGATDNGYIAYYANIVGPSITSLAELNTNNRYYILTERGSWAVDSDNKILKSNIQLELEMDMNDACQQFIISKENNKYYLYSPVEECYINKDCSLSSTPVDAINFKQGNKHATFVVYFDDNHYININGNKHIVIDSWKTPASGNSCYIKPID